MRPTTAERRYGLVGTGSVGSRSLVTAMGGPRVGTRQLSGSSVLSFSSSRPMGSSRALRTSSRNDSLLGYARFLRRRTSEWTNRKMRMISPRTIFGDAEYLPSQAVAKAYKPWHRPRKQFVRREQWSALLRRLYDEREPGDAVRYLGLPGTDLIDLRYLYEEVCRANERPLRFLGFNSDRPAG